MSNARELLHLLEQTGKTLASAESCTGGLFGKKMTDIPGSSKYYCGGVISYTNEVKEKLLAVPGKILETYGAVSEPVAKAMAQGVQNALGTDLGVSTTGIAGPQGDGSGKPVGLVYIAVCDCQRTVCRQLQLSGGREQVREQTCEQLFDLINAFLQER